MPPVPAPKTSTKQYPVKLDEQGVWRFKPDEADAQGDTELPGTSSAATDAGAAIDETVRGDVIAAAVRDLVNNRTVQAIEGAVFNVVKAIADAVKDATESEDDEQDDENDEDDEDDKDNEDNTPLRKKEIARKRERTPEETQPMSPETKKTPSTPDPDESQTQKVDDDGDERKIMSPCKKPKQEQQEQRGSDLAVMM